jgi:hypothetical protein
MLDRSAFCLRHAGCRSALPSAILTLKTPNDLVPTSMLHPIQERA